MGRRVSNLSPAELEARRERDRKRWSSRAAARNERRRKHPSPPQGPRNAPTRPHVPAGHEIAGVSTLTGPTGSVDEQWTKTRVAGNPDPAPPPPDFALRKVSTMQRGDGSEVVRWQSYAPDEVEKWAAFEAAVDRVSKRYRGLVLPKPAPRIKSSARDLLVNVNLGDEHLGMLAWGPEAGADFDSHIAAADYKRAVKRVIDVSPEAGRFLFASLGDFFHAQDDNQRTPASGHKLDVDTRFARIFDLGLELLRFAIDYALTKYPQVRFVAVPGNHDPNTPPMICGVLRAWYRNEPRVEISSGRSPFEFERFGKVLLGFTHKPTDRLSGVMAVDRAKDWGATEERVWHCGDIHHLTMKEHAGCVIESHRILATKDAWTHREGYRAKQGITSIVYHRSFGEESRYSVGLRRVRGCK